MRLHGRGLFDIIHVQLGGKPRKSGGAPTPRFKDRPGGLAEQVRHLATLIVPDHCGGVVHHPLSVNGLTKRTRTKIDPQVWSDVSEDK
jgi:hypothetical protein